MSSFFAVQDQVQESVPGITMAEFSIITDANTHVVTVSSSCEPSAAPDTPYGPSPAAESSTTLPDRMVLMGGKIGDSHYTVHGRNLVIFHHQ